MLSIDMNSHTLREFANLYLGNINFLHYNRIVSLLCKTYVKNHYELFDILLGNVDYKSAFSEKNSVGFYAWTIKLTWPYVL